MGTLIQVPIEDLHDIGSGLTTVKKDLQAVEDGASLVEGFDPEHGQKIVDPAHEPRGIARGDRFARGHLDQYRDVGGHVGRFRGQGVQGPRRRYRRSGLPRLDRPRRRVQLGEVQHGYG